MHRLILTVAMALLLSCSAAPAQEKNQGPIDWDYARQLHQKDQKGQALTDEEKSVPGTGQGGA